MVRLLQQQMDRRRMGYEQPDSSAKPTAQKKRSWGTVHWMLWRSENDEPPSELELQERDDARLRGVPRRDTMEDIGLVPLEGVSPRPVAVSWGTSDSECSGGSLETVSDINDLSLELDRLLDEDQPVLPYSAKVKKGLDVAAYMAEREMTLTQERVNAITMIPFPVYCIYFLLAGQWLSETLVEEARQELAAGGGLPDNERTLRNFGDLASHLMADDNGCVHSSLFPKLHALPPLPVVFVALGICLHAPFSFLYHWKYAHALPPGLARMEHWSRRLDQSMIHVASAFLSFSTSGSWDFFLANFVFNLDCFYRLFQERIRPRRNKIRIFISFLAYTFPILRRGDTLLFTEIWSVYVLGAWLFSRYPLGRWSHSAFHLVMGLALPLLLWAACELPASQDQLQTAARCVVLSESS